MKGFHRVKGFSVLSARLAARIPLDVLHLLACLGGFDSARLH